MRTALEELRRLAGITPKYQEFSQQTTEAAGKALKRPALYREEIVNAMARAFFVSSWADREEEEGRGHGGKELMDIAPETSQDAIEHSHKFAHQVEQANKKNLDELFADAMEADHVPEGSWHKYTSDFGHYLAMQGMGHGVSWFDDHEKFPLKIPHTEFVL